MQVYGVNGGHDAPFMADRLLELTFWRTGGVVDFKKAVIVALLVLLANAVPLLAQTGDPVTEAGDAAPVKDQTTELNPEPEPIPVGIPLPDIDVMSIHLILNNSFLWVNINS